MTAQRQGLAVDYNAIRALIATEIQAVTGIIGILEEPENALDARPCLPYFGFKITVPGAKQGDDQKQEVSPGVFNSGGQRKMTISFNCYAKTHEAAYNYMATWQTALDLEDVQQDLRAAGVAVWLIGNIADLTKLLNTGFEGRAHLDCTFGIAMNLQSNLGYMDQVTVDGAVTTDQGNTEDTSTTVIGP